MEHHAARLFTPNKIWKNIFEADVLPLFVPINYEKCLKKLVFKGKIYETVQ